MVRPTRKRSPAPWSGTTKQRANDFKEQPKSFWGVRARSAADAPWRQKQHDESEERGVDVEQQLDFPREVEPEGADEEDVNDEDDFEEGEEEEEEECAPEAQVVRPTSRQPPWQKGRRSVWTGKQRVTAQADEAPVCRRDTSVYEVEEEGAETQLDDEGGLDEAVEEAEVRQRPRESAAFKPTGYRPASQLAQGRRPASKVYYTQPSSAAVAEACEQKDTEPLAEKNKPKKRETVKTVLPIQERKQELLPLLCGEFSSNVCCLVGETGSGKSTQVPQILVEEAAKLGQPIRICVTQPRRVAALNLALRVASELGESELGETVGYRIGGESVPGEHIDFCTTGYLLQLLLNAPEEFGRYTHIILDEVHERSAESDMLCLVVRLLVGTKFLGTRLVVMSATLQSDLFSNYFASVASRPPSKIFVGTKCHPVTEHFLDEVADALKLRAATMNQINQRIKDVFAEIKPGVTPKRLDPRHCEKFQGIVIDLVRRIAEPGTTILVFLPGISEISSIWEEAKSMEDREHFKIFPLHSMIPREEQEMVFQEPEEVFTNVVLATDIAESSITLPNVVAVIDFGLHRRVDHDQRNGISALATKWISQAAAKQRAGRAGRTQPGICLRMYTREFYENSMLDFEPPEAQSMPLDRLYLQAKQLGEKLTHALGHYVDTTAQNLITQMVQAPDITSIAAARAANAEIGTITAAREDGRITAFGRLALMMPVDPRVARLVWLSVLWGIPTDGIVLASVLSSMDPFSAPSPLFIREERDFIDKLRGATSARLLFDGGEMSEPLMMRQLFLEWLAAFHKESWVYGTKEHIARKRRQHTLNFSWQFSLSRGRMEHLVSHVQELALRVYRACDPNSTNAHKVRELIRGLGYIINDRNDLAGVTYGTWTPFDASAVFEPSTALLKGLLAAAFSDNLFVGSYGLPPPAPIEMKPSNKPEQEKPIKRAEEMMRVFAAQGLLANQTLVFPAKEKTMERYVELVCGNKPPSPSKEIGNVPEDGEGIALVQVAKLGPARWRPLESRSEAPLLEDPTRLPPEFNLLHQFEKGMRECQKTNKNLQGWTHGLIPVQHPCLIHWEWIKDMQNAKGGLIRCHAIFDRKNPTGCIGYAQDIPVDGQLKPVVMFAVAASVSGSEKPGRAFPSGVTTLAPGHIAFLLTTATLDPTKCGLKRFGFTVDGAVTFLHRSVELPKQCIDQKRWNLICSVREALRVELGREEAAVKEGGAWTGYGPSLYDSPLEKKVRALLRALPLGFDAELAQEDPNTMPAYDLPAWTVDLGDMQEYEGTQAFRPLASWTELEARRGAAIQAYSTQAMITMMHHASYAQYQVWAAHNGIPITYAANWNQGPQQDSSNGSHSHAGKHSRHSGGKGRRHRSRSRHKERGK